MKDNTIKVQMVFKFFEDLESDDIANGKEETIKNRPTDR